MVTSPHHSDTSEDSLSVSDSLYSSMEQKNPQSPQPTDQNSKMSMEKLPAEILEKVFSAEYDLELKDCVAAKRVCRRLHSVLDAPGVVRPEVEEFA